MALLKGTNSFVTIQESDDYFNDRLYSDTWFSSDTLVEQALVTATGILDDIDWGGTALPTASYPLSWPRDITYYDNKSGYYTDLEDNRSTTSYGTIPEDIKKATYELALHLITNMKTVESNASGENKVKDLTVGSVRLIFDTASGITNFKELPDSIIKIVSKYYNEVSTTENRGVRVSGGA
tara:strand:+ start:3958 stop:4500 length:543 start_codon:yes stop_codon:yes gene_type:complete